MSAKCDMCGSMTNKYWVFNFEGGLTTKTYAEYHKKNQGILAVGNYIETKAEKALKDNELNKILEPFINKE